MNANASKCQPSIDWHACCTVGAAEVTTMNPISIVTPAVIPPDFLAVPVSGAPFTVPGLLVVAVVVALCAVLAMDDRWPSIAVGSLPLAVGERHAA